MSKPAILFGFLAAVTVAAVVAGRQSSGVEGRSATAKQKQDEPNRSPLAVAVHSNGWLCATANHTAGTVSFVDLKTGRILREHRCGRGPADVKWIDADRLLVSLLHDDALAVVRFDGKTNAAKTTATIPVGDEPRGIAIRDAGLAFVAVTNADSVAVVDLKANSVVRRIPVGGHPRTLAVAPNGKWLVTCCNIPARVYVHDARTFKQLSSRPVFDDGFNLGTPVILPGSSSVVIPHQINRTFPVHADNVEKGWVIDNRLTRLPLPAGKYWEQKQIGLDVRGKAAGDANSVAFSPDGRWLAVSCGGSHELLIIDRKHMKWPAADPGDFIPSELLGKAGGLQRVKLGGRPVAVQFLDKRRALVTNYLSNSLQVVNVVTGKLTSTISLGGPTTPGRVRRGEAIFYDADRSLDSWFSCHSCHTDGHTSGQTFDTLNDGNFDTYKLVPTLRGVTKTGPWTWHGWQKSLPASLKKSLRTTLSTTRKVTDDDIQALMAYLGSLEHPRSPNRTKSGRLTAAAQRGKLLFAGKAGCASCHEGKQFTATDVFKVGLESLRYAHPAFNPPTLRSLHARRRFLHDGRADSLRKVLTKHHTAEKTGGEKLTAKELDDLIAYLKSL